MHNVLGYIAKKKKFDLPSEVAQEIIDDSGGNLRKAILVFEALKMQSFVVSPLYANAYLICLRPPSDPTFLAT
jgi:DNA polymerase III delta prime subunit